MKKTVINIIGIPLVTIGLFVFQCSDPRFYFSELIWCFFISITLWQGNGWLIKLLNRHLPWRQPATYRVLIQIGLSVLFTIWLTYFAVKYLYAGVYHAHFSSLVFRGNLFVFLIISLLYNAVYTGGNLFKQWRESIVEAEEWKRQNLISQYEALKNQINPHFLFNSINTMLGLIEKHPKLAIEFGHRFAEIYRQILVKGAKELITLREEIQIIDIQSELLKSRFGKALNIISNIPENVMDKLLPPLSLQHLIENAIKHNQISTKCPLKIELDVENDLIRVVNNKQVRNYKTPSTETGLSNIRKRYQYFTDREVVIADNEGSFSVQIPLLDSIKHASTYNRR
ncbi:MAG: histidine kinase [Reichenbachiella sp.]|uniref:sensor histidine kinase n=1 Tax=Reichenbachiella sp. TaxID=2184521 RepID=UPI003266A9C8